MSLCHLFRSVWALTPSSPSPRHTPPHNTPSSSLTATVNVLSQRIDELEREKDRINDAVGKHVFTLDTRITKEVDSIKEDLEHKFALQVAENKRLLNQLVKQKNEAGSMRKYIEALEERIRLLQDEMGV